METKRPKLDKSINICDFSDFYWMKAELQEFCRKMGLSTYGGKIEITERIKIFLKTGNRVTAPPIVNKSKLANENYGSLSLNTIVKENFRFTREIRNFFETEAGNQFHFSVTLQRFIKENPGITFQQIINEWNRQREKGETGGKKKIDPQFEYNQFTRDYFTDSKNVSKTRKDCILAWKEIRSKRGERKYKPQT